MSASEACSAPPPGECWVYGELWFQAVHTVAPELSRNLAHVFFDRTPTLSDLKKASTSDYPNEYVDNPSRIAELHGRGAIVNEKLTPTD